ASLEYHGDGRFLKIHEKYVQLFKEPISFNDDDVGSRNDDGNGDDDGNGNGDDESNDKDGGNGDEKEEPVEDDGGNRDGNENGDGDDVDGGRKSSDAFTEKQVESTVKQSVDPTRKEKVVDEEAFEITCTPESYMQWLDENADFGDALNAIDEDLLRIEDSDAGPLTPERLATCASKASLSLEKRMVKPSSYLLSPYINKKMKTLSMFDGTLPSDEDKWEIFSAQVSAQFKDNVDGLALNGIDLAFFPICLFGHFYVVVFKFAKVTSMTILDNSDSGATYDSKYKEACEVLKKLFARHLKLYGHKRHASVGNLKEKIPKLKWKTKANFRDCGIFTMLHMESYIGETAKAWDCGLVAESKLQSDMLRCLRFKFATKILLHEVNVHARKMFELAKEFDKVKPQEKISIIVEAFKKREQRERN
ncbi:ulp1 protease family, C-terminal catalytic domain-containing protein, partial [Tanacetum coccineum]